MAGYKKPIARQPEGRVRRSQAVATFGPGAMMDLLDQAVLVGGLDFWTYDLRHDVPPIEEPRLRDAVLERLRDRQLALNDEQPFRPPPPCDERAPTKLAGIQVLEFPRWFVCQNPKCRVLVRKDALDLKGGRYWHDCSPGQRPAETVPVRFVAACTRGHLDDFPWIDFVHLHRPGGRCAAPGLSLDEGATGDFSEVVVRCVCGAENKLSAAMAGVPLQCTGQRPWLGTQGVEECEERLRLLVRTASNSYFTQEMSALSVPEPARELENKVREVMDVLKVATAETLPTFRQIPKVQVALDGFADGDVLAVVESIQRGTPLPRLALRTAEFKQFASAKREAPGDLPGLDEIFFARECQPKRGLAKGVRRVVVAPKLREVRAQVGFTRLEASTPNLQGEFDLSVRSAPLGLTTDWLPAVEIRGEGVFVELDEEAVRAWEARDAVRRRADELVAGHDTWASRLEVPPPFPGVRFYLLHSLSHLLITAISLECGYAASSIRERIYCGPSPADPETPMAAILLSTGTSGSEGTLGGLVEEGRKLRDHLAYAYDLGKLCSNDPVCAGHTPQGDRAERYLEGAACHGCLFIAECSCERFNRYLDRALVVPTVGRGSELAFFSERP
jgi:MrfA Zn-binding domain